MPKTLKGVRVARLPRTAYYRGFWGTCFTCGAQVPTGTGGAVAGKLFCDDCWSGSQPVPVQIAQSAPVQATKLG